jgi:[glutamine synthetase] adenylyltransferase / [glutamine synthetase]-adenylyl-L-tyrosine phosphorylase
MPDLAQLASLAPLPAPFDAAAAARGVNAWRELSDDGAPDLGEFARALADEPVGAALLRAVFGNSPFLGECLLAEPRCVRDLLADGPAATLAAILAELAGEVGAAGQAADLVRPLRLARRRVALVTALADIGGLWSLAEVTGALSAFADVAIAAATARLLADAAARGDIRLPHGGDPARDSGFVVYALGKLGGRELNFSSDVDLLVLYDQDSIAYTGRQSPQEFYVRLTSQLVRLLQERTMDGYVFRVDLRLRPDAGAAPVAMSMAAAENYYEMLGQNWERAALIKARVVGGDAAAGQAFLERIAPFSWRRNLDFAAIEDIHAIKGQIHRHKGHGTVAVAGHNIKVGRGGIREIEFFAQTQQLIAGGRDRRLRVRSTCDALRALEATGRLDAASAAELIAAYEFLRRLEHRLQMIADEQTHTLPLDAGKLRHVATFFGSPDADRFAAAVRRVLERVERAYAQLFERVPAAEGPGPLAFDGAEPDAATLATLAAMGFRETESLARVVAGWYRGHYRAMRTERARAKLTAILPKLLGALGRSAYPDAAFARFDGFLAGLPAGVPVFSLLEANPQLAELVAEVMGTAPRLAQHLSANPSLFDAMIEPEFYAPLPSAERLAAELSARMAHARQLEDALDAARQWVADRKLQIGLQHLRGGGDAAAAGAAFADVAEATLRALMPRVEAAFAAQHGAVADGAMAVLALGRMGGRAMTIESDLDLIFVYTHAPEAGPSSGAKPLAPGAYFARLSQRVINAITAPTAAGQLYAVDMRLRPSGNAGPVATRLDGFELYQRQSAWTWEHLALTHARIVAGPEPLAGAVEAIVRQALTRPRDAAQLAADVDAMRLKIAAEYRENDPWAIKYVRGGSIDLEFITQFLQLRHAAAAPRVLDVVTLGALRRLADAGCLSPPAAEELIADGAFLGELLSLMRLCQSERFAGAAAPAGVKAVLCRAAGAADFAALEARLMVTENRVRARYREFIGGAAG